jgi:hypothetical protein
MSTREEIEAAGTGHGWVIKSQAGVDSITLYRAAGREVFCEFGSRGGITYAQVSSNAGANRCISGRDKLAQVLHYLEDPAGGDQRYLDARNAARAPDLRHRDPETPAQREAFRRTARPLGRGRSAPGVS